MRTPFDGMIVLMGNKCATQDKKLHGSYLEKVARGEVVRTRISLTIGDSTIKPVHVESKMDQDAVRTSWRECQESLIA